MAKTIIIGGVAGGASCAARLRRLDEHREIILLEKGPYISYANCGLPYYVGDIIHEKKALLVTSKEIMQTRYHIDVRTENEVLHIHPADRTVEIIDHQTNHTYTESYDDLVIATGSSPFRPNIPGIESKRVHTLWTVPDAAQIRQMAEQSHSAAVVGGGFIGLEIAENLSRAGLDVTIIEGAEQVLPPLDKEMARLVENELAEQGIHLLLHAPVQQFHETDSGIQVIAEKNTVEADFAVLSIGVRPNTALAEEAGLSLNERGFVITDNHMKTSDPNIYAAGDIVQVKDAVTDLPAAYALAGPANKQGRIAADNIAGRTSTYTGSQGTSIAKIFRITAAMSGQSEKACLKRGMVKGRDFATAYVRQNSHAGYYPGAEPMMIKAVYEPEGRLLGAQIVGGSGVDKRIDTLAEAIRLKIPAAELSDLEFAYAPPYSSAKDPVNMLGFTIQNIQDNLVRFADWDILEKEDSLQILDVRELSERVAYAIPHAKGIALGELREHLQELHPDQKTVIFCAAGIRAYNAARILSQNGFTHVLVYPGGASFYRALHEDFRPKNTGAGRDIPEITRGTCSDLLQALIEKAEQLKPGQSVSYKVSDPDVRKEFLGWTLQQKNFYTICEGNTLTIHRK